MADREYLSCYSIALTDDVEGAKVQSHDNVIAGAGADRLSGVMWTFWSTDDAPVLHADAGDIPLPDDVVILCSMAPGRTLVMATVEVKPVEKECPHMPGILTPGTCSICKGGPTLRSAEPELVVTECGSCPAEVIWTKTEKGKSMPVDAVPDGVNGRYRVDHFDGQTPVVHYVKNSELESNTKPMYASHFQTCPDAESWRRSR